MDASSSSEVALSILELVHRLKTKYGKGTLSKILKGSKNRHIQHVVSEAGEGYGCLGLFSLEQVGDLVQQLLFVSFRRCSPQIFLNLSSGLVLGQGQHLLF